MLMVGYLFGVLNVDWYGVKFYFGSVLGMCLLIWYGLFLVSWEIGGEVLRVMRFGCSFGDKVEVLVIVGNLRVLV